VKPAEYYQRLVERHGVARYIMAPCQYSADELANRIFGEAQIDLPESYRRRIADTYAAEKAKPIFDHYIHVILDSVPEESRRKWSERIFVGEFPIGRVNAHCVRVPGGDGYVLLLNVGLMMLISATAKVVFSQAAWAAFDDSGKPIRETIRGDTVVSHEEAGTYLREMIRQYCRFKQWRPPVGRDRIVIKGAPMNIISAMLTEAAERFVLAHEFGHALHGHLERDETSSLSVPSIGIQIPAISTSWQDEIDADVAAGAIMLHSLPRRIDDRWTALQAEMVVAGPLFFFELARLVEKADATQYDTHPPTRQRSEILEAAFRRVIPEQAFSVAQSVTSVLASFEQYF
jgi:hypothetical protein